jgi:hypothetical protein
VETKIHPTIVVIQDEAGAKQEQAADPAKQRGDANRNAFIAC